ncbi:MAG: tetratricopeptide repeat protein [Chloroflexota bacterium]
MTQLRESGQVFTVASLTLIVLVISCSAYAETCTEWVGKVVSAQGNVQARRAGDGGWQQVQLYATFCPGDIIRVLGRSRADILLSNDTVIRVDQNTTMSFSEAEKKETPLIDLLDGAAYFFSRFPKGLKAKTPFVNASVEGTEFFLRVEGDKTVASIFEGTVALTNDAGSLTLTTGQSGEAFAHKAPQPRVVVRPRDAVQWALYYPPVLFYRATDFLSQTPSDWQAMVQKSIGSYNKGDIDGAFRDITSVPDDLRDYRFFVYRASLLLSVGRVNEARKDIDRAASLAPGNAEALALQTVISVVQNDKDGSLDQGRRAVRTAPGSAAALIALSYALQASFDLNGALDTLKKATNAEPENALAWARLAEVYSSLGYLDESLKAAQKAVALDPNLSRTQTVLGFAHLVQINTKASKDAFAKAIELDQADPLPRLGLGLAVIREGDLEPGRREIEIAASLDPSNSLIRSYLGKAYYEEKRNKLSVDQFTMAEDLDPSDPTPWFYEAIQKQSVNKPVEALHDMQKAIALNDNRAVYRSRLLLDSDLAARSASLARIYINLGFEQLGLVEGWKSVNTDPANFSGHRFLSDTYSAVPRHEIARVSELLQSQLLQPINVNPVPPTLAEPNRLILFGAGPTDPSFLEFNPLFNRNRLALQMSGVAGSDSTFGDEAVVSGVYQKLSFSLGQFHYETNGFRENDDQRQDIYNAFVQVSLSPETSVQAEYRYRDTDTGDLELRFNPDDFLPNLRQNQKTNYARLGFHHTFAPGSDLIAWAGYQYLKEDTTNETEFPIGTDTLDREVKQEGYVVEAQHLFRSRRLGITSGSGYFTADQKVTNDSVFVFGPSGPPLPPQRDVGFSDKDLRHANLYVYSQINYPDTVIFTLGASGDFLNGGLIDRDQFNPKIGVTWSPLPTTTLRAAVFRTLARPFINQQTIEPTQVAGFNQFFDDTDGTESWVYGGAVDQRFSDNLSGGLEYFQRDLKVPAQVVSFPAPDSPPVTEILRLDWKERLGRAYLYWTPHRWLALSAQYYYEKFDRDKRFAAGIEEVTTQRLPLGVNFYHPSGFFAGLVGTYVDQEGRFVPQGSAPGAPALPGSDSFWLFDASAGYRLPKRLGIITVVGKNLFDKSFKFQDTDINNPSIQPGRSVFVRATVSF